MKVFAACLLVINLFSFAAMGVDKRRARLEKWRIRERTLFLLALIGGSIGILAGMFFFRHKTRHLSFRIGIPAILVIQLACFFLLRRYFSAPAKEAKRIVRAQLQQISELDANTIASYISYESLVSDTGIPMRDSQAAEDAVLAFFKNFSYRIVSSQADKENASVSVLIKNIDADALAHDLAHSLTQARILSTDDPFQEPPAGKDLFELLYETLSENSYDVKETPAVFRLRKAAGNWEIIADDALQDELVGGLISRMKDPDILLPEEVLNMYMDKFDAMDADRWLSFLHVDDIFSTYSAAHADALDRLYMEAIARYFAWSCGEIRTLGRTAQASLTISSIDMPYVMEFYRKALLDYASTTRSITDDDAAVADESASLLLDAIRQHERAGEFPVEVTLTNDGGGWKLRIDDALTNAFLGDMQKALEVLSE